MKKFLRLSFVGLLLFFVAVELSGAKKPEAQSCSAGLNDAVYHRIPDPMRFHFSKEISILGLDRVDALVTRAARTLLDSVSQKGRAEVIVLLENVSSNIIDKISAHDIYQRLSLFGLGRRDVQVLDSQLKPIAYKDLDGTRLSNGDPIAVKLNVQARALALLLFRQNFKRPELGQGELLDHLIIARVSTPTELREKIQSNRRWSSRMRLSIGLDDAPFGLRGTPGVPRLQLPTQSLKPIERTRRIGKVQDAVARFLSFHQVIHPALIEPVRVRVRFISFDESSQRIWVESTLPIESLIRLIHLPSIHRIVSIPEPQSRAD